MRILLTGAFGNIGVKTLAELIAQGHKVRCFDTPTQANQRITPEKFHQPIGRRYGRESLNVSSQRRGQALAVALAPTN